MAVAWWRRRVKAWRAGGREGRARRAGMVVVLRTRDVPCGRWLV